MYIHFTYQLCKKYTKEKSWKENVIHQFKDIFSTTHIFYNWDSSYHQVYINCSTLVFLKGCWNI